MAHTRIAVSFDFSDLNPDRMTALRAARTEIGFLKVGLQAMTAELPSSGTVAHALRTFWSDDASLLWDAKLCDIPNTVAAAIYNLVGTVGGITLHASAGRAALKAAAQARAEKERVLPTERKTILFGVTVLTALDSGACSHIFGEQPSVKVLQFAHDCLSAGIDGLVCSGQELQILSDAGLAKHFTTLVPGIRPAWAQADDQARTMTPTEAARLGANYIVVGRPIWDGPYEPTEAVRLINKEIARP